MKQSARQFGMLFSEAPKVNKTGFYRFINIYNYIYFLILLGGFGVALLGHVPGSFYAAIAVIGFWKTPSNYFFKTILTFSMAGLCYGVIQRMELWPQGLVLIYISLASFIFLQDFYLMSILTVVLSGILYFHKSPPFFYVALLSEYFLLMLGLFCWKFQSKKLMASQEMYEASLKEKELGAEKRIRFISQISHEIRNPLNSIIGFSEVLQGAEIDEEHREYLRTIHKCSETLLHLINDVLDTSMLENNLLKLDSHNFDLKELHQDIFNLYAPKCREKGIELKVKIYPEVGNIYYGDSFRLRQILINLVTNAMKFTARGEILIQVEPDLEKNLLKWKIQDTGCGIGSECVSRVFEEFFQENSAQRREYGGAGLGLSIVKSLVERMGGEISVQSVKGRGSTFIFTLALKEIYGEVITD